METRFILVLKNSVSPNGPSGDLVLLFHLPRFARSRGPASIGNLVVFEYLGGMGGDLVGPPPELCVVHSGECLRFENVLLKLRVYAGLGRLELDALGFTISLNEREDGRVAHLEREISRVQPPRVFGRRVLESEQIAHFLRIALQDREHEGRHALRVPLVRTHARRALHVREGSVLHCEHELCLWGHLMWETIVAHSLLVWRVLGVLGALLVLFVVPAVLLLLLFQLAKPGLDLRNAHVPVMQPSVLDLLDFL